MGFQPPIAEVLARFLSFAAKAIPLLQYKETISKMARHGPKHLILKTVHS